MELAARPLRSAEGGKEGAKLLDGGGWLLSRYEHREGHDQVGGLDEKVEDGWGDGLLTGLEKSCGHHSAILGLVPQ